MELRILGSGSSGNCYILQTKSGQRLMIEAGVKWKKIQKDPYVDFGRDIVGCLVSHEHIDHSIAIADVVRHRIPIYTSEGTASALNLEDNCMLTVMIESSTYKIGEFSVIPFEVQHDANEPFGFLINHPECGTICFATDFTGFRYSMDNVNVWMVECNYEQKRLRRNYESGKISRKRFLRTQDTHMELGRLDFELSLQDLRNTRRIILLHLSDENSDVELFRRFILAKTGFPTFFAKSGITFSLF